MLRTRFLRTALIVLFSFIASYFHFAPATHANPQAMTKVVEANAMSAKSGARKFVFPEKVSVGKLVWSPNAYDAKYPYARLLQNKKGHLNEDAKGVVTLPAGGCVYLIGTYELANHPEVLATMKADDLVEVCLSKVGVDISVDRLIEPISRLHGLRALELQYAEVPDAIVGKLKTLSNLQCVDMSYCNLTGKCLKDLTAIKHLKRLVLANNPLDLDSFKYMAQFPDLVELNIAGATVDDAGVAEIAKLKHIVSLSFAAKAPSRSLRRLLAMKTLKYLDFRDGYFRPIDLIQLAPLKPVRVLTPHSWSQSDQLALERAMPGTVIAGAYDRREEHMQMFSPLH